MVKGALIELFNIEIAVLGATAENK